MNRTLLREAFSRYRKSLPKPQTFVPMTETEIDGALRDIKYRGTEPLTLWEQTFVAGMERAVELKIPFSNKRQNSLRRIHKTRVKPERNQS